jgi:hypothetical protein
VRRCPSWISIIERAVAELLRSNVELAKRVFLDRLTTDDQPLTQADMDVGPGDEYEYGGVYDIMNFGVGADCSGSAGIFCGYAINGPHEWDNGYKRLFSTETFPGPLGGFRRVSRDDLLGNPYPIKVCIMHGGGGPNSHMNCFIDGWLMESNGSHGTCTDGHGAIAQSSNYWNDFWVHDGPITEDTTWRQAMGYPRGFDYAGGRPNAAAIKAAGGTFVCRYLSDGGPGLPGKQLQPAEAQDLINGGIGIVSNWETTATRMKGGYAAGQADAAAARDWVVHCGGPADGVIYFSADWDTTEGDQVAVNEYLRACCDVLGGPQHVGIYGGFWSVSRALNAGRCNFAWQAEAWSGNNRDARANIFQRNGLGYATVGGVQADINEAHTPNFGQWGAVTAPPPPPPAPAPPADPFAELLANGSELDLLRYLVAQVGPGDPGWTSKGSTLRDKVWSLAPTTKES